MIKKKDLLKRIEQIERELEETKEVFDFAITYGKDNFKFWSSPKNYLWSLNSDYIYYIYVQYLKENKLFKTKIEVPYYVGNNSIRLFEKIDDDNYIIKCQTYISSGVFDKYLQLTKSSGQIIDITEIKQRYENQEKVSKHLKDSAESLGNALSTIFSAPKKKAQKKAKISEKTKTKCDCEKKSCKKGAK